MNGYDTSNVPEKFYSFYCLFISLQLLLIAVYATYIFLTTKYLKTKLLLLWLAVAESVTLIDHLLRKYILLEAFNGIIATLIIFAVCCSFVVHRAFKKLESDSFKPGRTYIASYLPKDYKGLVNYLFTCSGHKAIYQDGFLYGFSKKTGAFVQKIATHEILMKANLKEIPRATCLDSLIGKRFNLITFNCNHLEKYGK